MKYLVALLLCLIPAVASAQQIRSNPSPAYALAATPALTLSVGQWDEYNVLLTANGTINFSVPVISSASILFRINTCQNATGGFTPTFTAVGSTTIVNRVGATITTLAANACDTEEWSYRQSTNQLVLESISYNTGTPPSFAITANSITGTGTTPTISNFSVNGVVNPIAYGAVNSTTTISATTNGTTAVTLGGAGDFQNGQFVALPNVGPASPLAAPLWCTTITCGGVGANYPIIQAVAGGTSTGTTSYSWCIKTVDKQLGESACGSTQTITTGPSMLGPKQYALLEWAPVANALGYKVMGCKGASCTMQEIKYIPEASIGGTLFRGTADFGENTTTPMLVAVGDGTTTTFTCPSAACKDVPSTTRLTTGLFTITPKSLTVQAGSVTCTDDGANNLSTGAGCGAGTVTYTPGASAAFTAIFSSAPATGTPIYANFTPSNLWYSSTSAVNQWLFTTIASGAGTTSIVLANPASQSISTQMLHDSTPIQTALNALGAAAPTPAGGIVSLQRGSYCITRPLSLPSQVTFTGHGGGTNYGTAAGEVVAPGFAWGTTLVWCGPDGLDMVDAYDGMRQQINGMNLDVRNIMGTGGAATSQSMGGVHIDTSSIAGTGDDKFQSDSVSIYGAHHSWIIGGNAVADNSFPSGDVSEIRLNKPHVLDPGTADPRAIGYGIVSANAGFNSTFDEPACLLDANICIWNVAGSGLRVMDAQGSVQAGADLAFILWDTGAGGFITTDEDENTSGLSFRVSPMQPNALGATTLIGNRFNHGVRIDGQTGIVSEANNTGGNTSVGFQLNNSGAAVFATLDQSQQAQNQWTKTSAGGHIYQITTTGFNITDQITGTGTNSTITKFSVNGALNAQAYGAIGDAIYSGDGVRASGDGTTTASGTTLSSPTGAFTSALVGDSVFIDGAGTAGALYVGTVGAFVSSTSLTVTPSTPTAVTSTAHYVIGFDNTTALQSWINAMRTAAGTGRGPEGYLPVGTYLHRGLDFTNWSGFKLTGAGNVLAPGGGGEGGSAFLCIAPTTTPKVCHDFSGIDTDTVRDLTWIMGTTDAEAGKVNVQIARVSNAHFGTLNHWSENIFRAFGGTSSYNVVLYGAEQSQFTDNMFNSNLDTAKALYISNANTPGFTSPTVGALVTAPTSMSVVTIDGGRTQISSNGNAAITIDGGVIDLSLIGIYGQLHGATDAFITDVGGSGGLQDFTEIGTRVEAQGNTAEQYMNLAGTLSWSRFIGGDLLYSAGGTGTAPAIQAAIANQNSIEDFFVTGVPAISPNPVVKFTTGVDNYVGGANRVTAVSMPSDNGQTHTYSGALYALGGVGSAAQHLALFPVCGPSFEGLFGTQDNSTAACVNGTTATSAGTTHCVIYCNGTNWIQTGASAFTTLSASGQVTSTLATGTAPFSIASTTPVANLTTVPTTYNHSGTQATAARLVQDSAALTANALSVTLTGSAVYTSATSYSCSCLNTTTTHIPCYAQTTSGSAVNFFTVGGGATDTINYSCAGN